MCFPGLAAKATPLEKLRKYTPFAILTAFGGLFLKNRKVRKTERIGPQEFWSFGGEAIIKTTDRYFLFEGLKKKSMCSNDAINTIFAYNYKKSFNNEIESPCTGYRPDDIPRCL